MYLQTGDMGGMIICEEKQSEKTQVQVIKTDVQERHHNLRKKRKKRNFSDFFKCPIGK